MGPKINISNFSSYKTETIEEIITTMCNRGSTRSSLYVKCCEDNYPFTPPFPTYIVKTQPPSICSGVDIILYLYLPKRYKRLKYPKQIASFKTTATNLERYLPYEMYELDHFELPMTGSVLAYLLWGIYTGMDKDKDHDKIEFQAYIENKVNHIDEDYTMCNIYRNNMQILKNFIPYEENG